MEAAIVRFSDEGQAMDLQKMPCCIGAALLWAPTAWADLVSEPEVSSGGVSGPMTLVIVAVAATAVVALSVIGLGRIRKK